jgi:hypothetical protein
MLLTINPGGLDYRREGRHRLLLVRVQIARLGIVGDEIDQFGPFVVAPDLLGRAGKQLRLGNSDRPGLHGP